MCYSSETLIQLICTNLSYCNPRRRASKSPPWPDIWKLTLHVITTIQQSAKTTDNPNLIQNICKTHAATHRTIQRPVRILFHCYLFLPVTCFSVTSKNHCHANVSAVPVFYTVKDSRSFTAVHQQAFTLSQLTRTYVYHYHTRKSTLSYYFPTSSTPLACRPIYLTCTWRTSDLSAMQAPVRTRYLSGPHDMPPHHTLVYFPYFVQHRHRLPCFYIPFSFYHTDLVRLPRLQYCHSSRTHALAADKTIRLYIPHTHLFTVRLITNFVTFSYPPPLLIQHTLKNS